LVKPNNGYSLRCILFFCSFVKGLGELYPELFDADLGDATQHQINFAKKWKAYPTIVELAGGDIQKINEVVKEPLEKCLLFLAYQSDKNLLEKILHDNAMNGLQ
jgi:hypothetical protein